MNRHGQIQKLTGIWRSRDRWRGLVAGLFNWKIDLLADHSMKLYAKHIATEVEKENRAVAAGREADDDDELVIRAASDERCERDSVAT